MSFIDRSSKVFGGLAELKFQAVIFGRDAVYLECVKPMRLDAAEMIFRAQNCVITLTGANLVVKDMSDKCVCITGRVDNLAVTDL